MFKFYDLYSVLSIAVGNTDEYTLPKDIDLEGLYELSKRQGVAALAFDGLMRLYELYPGLQLPWDKQLRRDWFGTVVGMEVSYEKVTDTLNDLSDLYASNNIRMLLLKGWGLSKYYPIPAHRPLGDIDIYLFGKQKEADALIQEKKGIKVRKDKEHHTVFKYDGFTVENHYDFINTKIRRSGRSFDNLLKTMVGESGYKMSGSFYLPGARFNMLFLMKHMSGHFASEGIVLRHVLDWALFVRAESASLDWESFFDICHKYNTHKFISCINAICVDYLGFNSSLFPVETRDSDLEERVLNDIMNFEQEKRPRNKVAELVFKTCKWFRTRWKQRICYNDSAISSFWTSVLANLREPIVDNS